MSEIGVATLQSSPQGESVPCLFQLLVAVGIPWLVAAAFQFLCLSSYHLLLRVCKLFLGFPLVRTAVTAFRAHPDNLAKSLITFAKTLFPNKVTFIGSRH